MSNQTPLMFDQAVNEAQTYIGQKEKLYVLLDEANGTAEHHYEVLVEAWESLQIFLRLVRSWLDGRYHIPAVSLLMVIGALIYLVNPLDLIPDSIPILGLVDDAAVITFVARANIEAISRFRNWEKSIQ
jgi:uncharacterized membrane protein YkvA (DUF1232 family)